MRAAHGEQPRHHVPFLDQAVDLHAQILLPRARIGYRPDTGGHMVALLECVAGDADPGLARAVPEPVMSQELWAVVHADMKRNARTRAMIDYLAELVSANPDVLDGRRRI